MSVAAPLDTAADQCLRSVERKVNIFYQSPGNSVAWNEFDVCIILLIDLFLSRIHFAGDDFVSVMIKQKFPRVEELGVEKVCARLMEMKKGGEHWPGNDGLNYAIRALRVTDCACSIFLGVAQERFDLCEKALQNLNELLFSPIQLTQWGMHDNKAVRFFDKLGSLVPALELLVRVKGLKSEQRAFIQYLRVMLQTGTMAPTFLGFGFHGFHYFYSQYQTYPLEFAEQRIPALEFSEMEKYAKKILPPNRFLILPIPPQANSQKLEKVAIFFKRSEGIIPPSPRWPLEFDSYTLTRMGRVWEGFYEQYQWGEKRLINGKYLDLAAVWTEREREGYKIIPRDPCRPSPLIPKEIDCPLSSFCLEEDLRPLIPKLLVAAVYEFPGTVPFCLFKGRHYFQFEIFYLKGRYIKSEIIRAEPQNTYKVLGEQKIEGSWKDILSKLFGELNLHPITAEDVKMLENYVPEATTNGLSPSDHVDGAS